MDRFATTITIVCTKWSCRIVSVGVVMPDDMLTKTEHELRGSSVTLWPFAHMVLRWAVDYTHITHAFTERMDSLERYSTNQRSGSCLIVERNGRLLRVTHRKLRAARSTDYFRETHPADRINSPIHSSWTGA